MISSCDVYMQYDLLRGADKGASVKGRINESAPLRKKPYPYRGMASGPGDFYYDYDKIPAEKVILDSPSAEGVVIRLPMVYGPNDYQYRFYEYVKRMHDNRPAILLEENQALCRISRGYVNDCARAIAMLAEDEKNVTGVYNFSDTETISEIEWVRRIAQILKWPGKIITLPNDKMPTHLKTDENWAYHLDIDSSLLRKRLSFTDEISRDVALEETISWQLANPPEKSRYQFDYPAEDNVLADL